MNTLSYRTDDLMPSSAIDPPSAAQDFFDFQDMSSPAAFAALAGQSSFDFQDMPPSAFAVLAAQSSFDFQDMFDPFAPPDAATAPDFFDFQDMSSSAFTAHADPSAAAAMDFFDFQGMPSSAFTDPSDPSPDAAMDFFDFQGMPSSAFTDPSDPSPAAAMDFFDFQGMPSSAFTDPSDPSAAAAMDFFDFQGMPSSAFTDPSDPSAAAAMDFFDFQGMPSSAFTDPSDPSAAAAMDFFDFQGMPSPSFPDPSDRSSPDAPAAVSFEFPVGSDYAPLDPSELIVYTITLNVDPEAGSFGQHPNFMAKFLDDEDRVMSSLNAESSYKFVRQDYKRMKNSIILKTTKSSAEGKNIKVMKIFNNTKVQMNGLQSHKDVQVLMHLYKHILKTVFRVASVQVKDPRVSMVNARFNTNTSTSSTPSARRPGIASSSTSSCIRQ
eukprot:gene12736-15982_t